MVVVCVATRACVRVWLRARVCVRARVCSCVRVGGLFLLCTRLGVVPNRARLSAAGSSLAPRGKGLLGAHVVGTVNCTESVALFCHSSLSKWCGAEPRASKVRGVEGPPAVRRPSCSGVHRVARCA